MSVRSLRGRLGALVALGLFVVTAAAATGIMVERWQEEQSGLRDDVEIAAFRLSETQDPTNPTVDLPAGDDGFAVIFDDEGNVIAGTTDLPDELVDILVEEIWVIINTADEVFTVSLDDREPPLTVAGVGCLDDQRCDSIVVGVSEEPFGSYLLRHLLWVVGSALVAGGLGMVAARWLVGRSLEPVDEMRAQLDQITESDVKRRVPVPGSGDELQQLGESMNATLTRLGAAVSANERFVADAAHELRSPIAGVRAALEVENGRTPSSLLGDSLAELDRAARLIDDLLILARRQSGPPKLVEIDLDDVARTAVTALRARRPDLHVETKLVPCRTRGNADDLRRVVTNLLDNAADHGGGHVLVSSGTVDGGSFVRVEDDGPGIDPNDRELIFERFARTDESRDRATGGSGLGLAIASELATDHHGSIIVSASTLGGAAFTLELPAAD